MSSCSTQTSLLSSMAEYLIDVARHDCMLNLTLTLNISEYCKEEIERSLLVFCERPHTSSIVQDPSAFLICIFIMKSCVSNIKFLFLFIVHGFVFTDLSTCIPLLILIFNLAWDIIFIMRSIVFMDLRTLALPF